ncbi:MAG: endonuclease/exonuclease/phosphatase family protein [Rhodothermia bacterium]|nr:endonuclease/exonuclease/phosphatase family protein [Rhodothermia bacterium]
MPSTDILRFPNERALRSVKIIPLLILAASQLASAAYGQGARIVMDGLFDDWDLLTAAHIDPSSGAVGVDFGRLWITTDERYLILRVEVGVEVLIQEGNEIILYADTDDDANTGLSIHGIGAELEWHFGSRLGTIYSATGASSPIGHAQIGIVTSPTVSSDEFEIAFALDATPDGTTPLFAGEAIRVVIQDGAVGDRLPDALGGVHYLVSDASKLPPLEIAALGKQQPSDVRLLSYNVERDGLFDAGRSPAFRRILRALAPDLIGFQEVLAHTASEAQQVVSTVLRLPPGEQWHSDRISDLVVVSRYPILDSFPIRGVTPDPANGAFLLDVRSQWGTDLLVVMAHPPCCRADEARQVEIDAIMAFLRSAMTEGGNIDLEDGTPVILLGDMNLVGFAQQLTTLLTGDIVNTGPFGAPFKPDWDGTDLADLMPRHTSLPMTFTWYNEESSFHPGRLDFMIYTDSVLEPGSRYVLFTPELHPDTLASYGLSSTDATVASDHLPVVGDFRYVGAGTGIHTPADLGDDSRNKMRHSPNPVAGIVTVTYELPHSSYVSVEVFDMLGRQVAVAIDGFRLTGVHSTVIDVGSLPSGIYAYRLVAGRLVDHGKMVVAR